MAVIRWVNVKQKAAGMSALATRVGSVHSYRWAYEVAEAGEKTIESIARVDTGWMKGSVGSDAISTGSGSKATAGYGMTMKHPFYTKFQEYGTRHGIKPMNSIIAAHQTMSVEAVDAGDRMLGRIAGDWNKI